MKKALVRAYWAIETVKISSWCLKCTTQKYVHAPTESAVMIFFIANF